MDSIDKSVSEALKHAEKTTDKDVISSLEKSVSDFHEMVNQGIAQPRGYRLQTIDSSSSSVIMFNVWTFRLDFSRLFISRKL